MPPVTSVNTIVFNGTDWFGIYNFGLIDDVNSTVTNEANIKDDDFTTFATWSLGDNAATVDLDLYLPPSIEQYGLNTINGANIDVLFFFGTFGATAANLFQIGSLMGVAINDNILWNTTYQLEDNANTGDLVGEGICKLQMN
ncbi:hypothetical protein LCGC14_2309350, partial [marine sediment metagenome]